MLRRLKPFDVTEIFDVYWYNLLAPAAASLLVSLGFRFRPVFITAFALFVMGAVAIMPIKSVR